MARLAMISLLGAVSAQAAEESVYVSLEFGVFYWFFQDFWFFRLLMNLAGYASLIVPAFFYKRYLDKQGYKSEFQSFEKKFSLNSRQR